MSTTPVLHYIYDPLCGWCYGASPLVQAARDIVPVRAHGGGMMSGAARRPVTPELRDYVIPHDRRSWGELNHISLRTPGSGWLVSVTHRTACDFA